MQVVPGRTTGWAGSRRSSRAAPARAAESRPWPYSTALLVAYAGAAVVTAVAVAAGADRHPVAGLPGYALLAVVVGMRSRPLAAPAVAVIAWLFDDGFLAGRHADLAWPGAAGGWWLAVLLAAAAAGAALGAALRRHPRQLPSPASPGVERLEAGHPEVGHPAPPAAAGAPGASWPASADVRAWQQSRHTGG